MKFEINAQNKGDYDVIVVGSGPAGISAAVSAGRNGVKTLLIESLGRVGGVSTAGMMSHFTGRVGNPLYHEILERAAQKNNYEKGKIKVQIDPELLTLTYIEMLEEASMTTFAL